MTDYTVYDLEKDRQTAKHKMTDTQVTLKRLTRRAEGRDHILQIDNLFSSPDLFNSLHKN
jgi:hypothetical protein